tara:strand:+ start:69790 stop:70143 length:354 start_codon:yes stop_codon:yes gene_type:complete
MKRPVIGVGVINIQSGVTKYNWSIYENKGLYGYLTDGGFLLLGAKDSLVNGDTYDLIGNDSRRRLSKFGSVIDSCSCANKDEFIKWLKSHGYDYTKLRPFKKRAKGNRKLITSYSLK